MARSVCWPSAAVTPCTSAAAWTLCSSTTWAISWRAVSAKWAVPVPPARRNGPDPMTAASDADWVADFSRHLASERRLSANTVKHHRRDLERARQALDGLHWRRVTVHDLRA